ncbi:protein ABHD15-like [Polypterus senegalus]
MEDTRSGLSDCIGADMAERVLLLLLITALGAFFCRKVHLKVRLLCLSRLAKGTSEKPQLICKPSALASYLLLHCASLGEPSTPKWPWGDPHVQTLASLAWPLGQVERIDFARDHIQMKDGGVVALDWAVGITGIRERNWKAAPPFSSPPVMLIIPNSWGQVTGYVLGLCRLALEQGFYPVLFQRRGQSGCPLVTPKFQQFGDPSDLIEAVSYIRYRYPGAALVAVSEGSGSGLLLSYLGECGSSSYLTCAACVSPVFRGQQWFESRLHWLYRWALLFCHKLPVSRYATALSQVLDVDRLLSCSSLQQFEEILFCGHSSENVPKLNWESYWEKNEPLRDADEVAVPVLCLCSWDDPIRGDPALSVPFELFESSPYFFLVLTRMGGHCGFSPDSNGSVQCWSQALLLEYFRGVAEFLRMEERRPLSSGSPRRRTATLLPRRRRGTVQQRDPPLRRALPVSFSSEDLFSWQRSYTR